MIILHPGAKIRVAVDNGKLVVPSIRTGEAPTEHAPIEHTTKCGGAADMLSSAPVQS
jgi:hypothetical protein